MWADDASMWVCGRPMWADDSATWVCLRPTWADDSALWVCLRPMWADDKPMWADDEIIWAEDPAGWREDVFRPAEVSARGGVTRVGSGPAAIGGTHGRRGAAARGRKEGQEAAGPPPSWRHQFSKTSTPPRAGLWMGRGVMGVYGGAGASVGSKRTSGPWTLGRPSHGQGRMVWQALRGDVPRSPWPAEGVVQDLGRLYRLRPRLGFGRSYPGFQRAGFSRM